MIEISNVRIYGLEDVQLYSGLPMSDSPSFSYDRVIKLCDVPVGTGHDNCLKGVIVQFLLRAPHYFILELQRYKFVEIVSSTSKMHQMKNEEFFLNNLPKNITKTLRKELVNTYFHWADNPTDENFSILINSLPLGFTLKEFLTTNLLSLKNIYYQRRNHKLQEWHQMCDFIKGLPIMRDILR